MSRLDSAPSAPLSGSDRQLELATGIWPLRLLILTASLLLLHAPFLYDTAVRFWSRDHYRFFPLVGAAAVLLVMLRSAEVLWQREPRLTLRVLLVGIPAALLLTAAVLMPSSWVGVLSALAWLWTLVWFCGGSQGAEILRGPFLLLLLLVPLPLELDRQLVVMLQKVASTGSSALLDLVSIRHLVTGVAITTPNRSFLVEEACSGIYALFSGVGVMVFVSVLEKRKLLHTLLNIIQTAGWVIVANALRVFVIVFAFERYDVTLESGWEHDLLGVLTFLLALGMALSTDRLLLLLIPSALSNLQDVVGEAEAKPAWILIMNDWLNRPLMTANASFGLAVGLSVLMAVPLSMAAADRLLEPVAVDQPIAGRITDRVIRDAVLPLELDEWRLVNVERIDRDADHAMGISSVVFTYAGSGLTVLFSLDGYYQEWHDLATCYSGLGWTLQEQRNTRNKVSGIHATMLSMTAPDGQHALCLFSCFDRNDQPVVPKNRTAARLKARLQGLNWSADANDDSATAPPVFQTQLVCRSRHEFLGHELGQLRTLFHQLSQHAVQALREETE